MTSGGRSGTLGSMMTFARLGHWPAALVWLLASVVVGNGLNQWLDGRASLPALLVEILLWFGWFVVLVAVLTPSPRSLTICRIAGPAAMGVSIVSAFSTAWTSASVLAVGFAALFSGLVFLPLFGDRMINGSAYGSERRMALRPTAAVLLGPAQLAWLLVFVGLITGPALLLNERYVLAGFAAVVGVVLIWAGGRILHQLARRWIVFVPAGFVIHDPMQVVDAVLFRRHDIKSLGPALLENEPTWSSGVTASAAPRRTDLSGGALGLALEVALKESVPIGRRTKDGMTNVETGNVVFSPTLPGALLSEARIRGIKIGEASNAG